MRFIVSAAAVAGLLIATPAQAATLYVANSCSGAPAPCSTDLQGALDNGSYDRIEIVANETITGEFLIRRSLTLKGQSNAAIERPSGSVFALHVEGATNVDVMTVDFDGTVAVYDSSDVGFYSSDIAGLDEGLRIIDSDDVLIRVMHITADKRAIDIVDSTQVDIIGGSASGGDYGIVNSGSTLSALVGDIYGDVHSAVVQDGPGSIDPDFDASTTSFSVGGSNDHVLRWDRATATYTSCTPTPTEDVTTTASPVTVLGYTPYGGD